MDKTITRNEQLENLIKAKQQDMARIHYDMQAHQNKLEILTNEYVSIGEQLRRLKLEYNNI